MERGRGANRERPPCGRHRARGHTSSKDDKRTLATCRSLCRGSAGTILARVVVKRKRLEHLIFSWDLTRERRGSRSRGGRVRGPILRRCTNPTLAYPAASARLIDGVRARGGRLRGPAGAESIEAVPTNRFRFGRKLRRAGFSGLATVDTRTSRPASAHAVTATQSHLVGFRRTQDACRTRSDGSASVRLNAAVPETLRHGADPCVSDSVATGDGR